jgi:hypothetical protein
MVELILMSKENLTEDPPTPNPEFIISNRIKNIGKLAWVDAR